MCAQEALDKRLDSLARKYLLQALRYKDLHKSCGHIPHVFSLISSWPGAMTPARSFWIEDDLQVSRRQKHHEQSWFWPLMTTSFPQLIPQVKVLNPGRWGRKLISLQSRTANILTTCKYLFLNSRTALPVRHHCELGRLSFLHTGEVGHVSISMRTPILSHCDLSNGGVQCQDLRYCHELAGPLGQAKRICKQSTVSLLVHISDYVSMGNMTQAGWRMCCLSHVSGQPPLGRWSVSMKSHTTWPLLH